MDWDDLRYFLAVHRGGTLAQAAAALQVNPTTVGRRLVALEDALGSRLFDRTPDGFVATDAGKRLLPTAERVEDEMLTLQRDLSGGDTRAEGVVRISATEMLATRLIAPQLPALLARYPEVQIELICTPRNLDLSRRETDIALRLSRPEEDSLVIKRLWAIHLGLYAAHEYLEAQPYAGDSGGHRLLGFAQVRGFARENEWLEQALPAARVAVRSSSVSSVYAACVSGLGIALLPRLVGDRDRRLTRLPVEPPPQPRWVWQVVHRDMQSVARVRVVLDFLADTFTLP